MPFYGYFLETTPTTHIVVRGEMGNFIKPLHNLYRGVG